MSGKMDHSYIGKIKFLKHKITDFFIAFDIFRAPEDTVSGFHEGCRLVALKMKDRSNLGNFWHFQYIFRG